MVASGSGSGTVAAKREEDQASTGQGSTHDGGTEDGRTESESTETDSRIADPDWTPRSSVTTISSKHHTCRLYAFRKASAATFSMARSGVAPRCLNFKLIVSPYGRLSRV